MAEAHEEPGDARAPEAREHRASHPETRIELRGERRRRERADARHHEHRAHVARGEAELARGVEHDDRDERVAEDLPQADRPHERAQRRVVPHDREALAHFRDEVARPCLRRVGRRRGNPAQHQRRHEEAERVEQDREGRREPLDEHAREPGPTSCAAESEMPIFAFASTEVAPSHALGHEDLVRGPADDRARADEEAHDVERRHVEEAEPRTDRHRQEGQGAPDIRRDDDRKLRQAIDEHARGKPEEREGERLEGREDPDFEGCRVQEQRRGERQCEERDLPAEVGDRERAPELHEVRVSPEASEPLAGMHLFQDRGHCSSFRWGQRPRFVSARRKNGV
jgi:hypothetical protein